MAAAAAAAAFSVDAESDAGVDEDADDSDGAGVVHASPPPPAAAADAGLSPLRNGWQAECVDPREAAVAQRRCNDATAERCCTATTLRRMETRRWWSSRSPGKTAPAASAQLAMAGTEACARRLASFVFFLAVDCGCTCVRVSISFFFAVVFFLFFLYFLNLVLSTYLHKI